MLAWCLVRFSLVYCFEKVDSSFTGLSIWSYSA